MRIQGSVALVTGANRGLGAAFARGLLAAGAAKVLARSVAMTETADACGPTGRPKALNPET
jgi:NAD(P)-dependent dehydrogenase (short-subunit alcohol dehydrogenase family)